jgi:hypothetical protein
VGGDGIDIGLLHAKPQNEDCFVCGSYFILNISLGVRHSSLCSSFCMVLLATASRRHSRFAPASFAKSLRCSLILSAATWFQPHSSFSAAAMSTHTTERDGSGTITVSPKNEAAQSGLVVICHGLGDSAEGFSDVAEVSGKPKN